MSFQLTTDRLLLQVEDSSKAKQILDFYVKNKALFEQYEPTRPSGFYTLDFQTACIDYEYQDTMNGKALRYYVYRREAPDQLIGSVNFSRMEHGPFSKAALGYKFDADFHHRGYAFEACQAALHVIFSNYRIHRIEARVAPDNIPSIKLLEHLQFQYEGIEYQSVEVCGIFRDHYRYGLISTIQ